MKMILATTGGYARLLGSYKNRDLGDFADLFGIGIYSSEDAAYLLDMIKNKEDTIPTDLTPWLTIEYVEGCNL
jgi:hypothetical protein